MPREARLACLAKAVHESGSPHRAFNGMCINWSSTALDHHRDGFDKPASNVPPLSLGLVGTRHVHPDYWQSMGPGAARYIETVPSWTGSNRTWSTRLQPISANGPGVHDG